MMYEKYILCKKDMKNVVEDGKITGVSLNIRLPYYRGMPLCALDDLIVSLDGIEYPKEKLKLTVSGGTFSFEEIPTVSFFRWEFGEEAVVTVEKPGGLEVGKHDVEVSILLRISYMPLRGWTKGWGSLNLV